MSPYRVFVCVAVCVCVCVPPPGKTALELAKNAREHWKERMMAGADNAAKRHHGAAECCAALDNRGLMRCARDNDLRRIRFLVLQQGEDPTLPNQCVVWWLERVWWW